jgi:hypothetical protein
MERTIDELFEEGAEEQVADIDTSDDNLGKLLVDFRTHRDEKDRLEALTRDENKLLDELETMILRIMEARGLTSLRKEGVGLISVVPNPWPKVLEFDKMVAWLTEHGHDGIAKMNINAQTLRSWVKEMKENGAELPPPDVMEDKAGTALRLRR